MAEEVDIVVDPGVERILGAGRGHDGDGDFVSPQDREEKTTGKLPHDAVVLGLPILKGLLLSSVLVERGLDDRLKLRVDLGRKVRIVGVKGVDESTDAGTSLLADVVVHLAEIVRVLLGDPGGLTHLLPGGVVLVSQIVLRALDVDS